MQREESRTDLGAIRIHKNVIASIASIAAIEIEGVKLSTFLRQAYMYGQGNYLVQHLHKDLPLLKEIKTQSMVSFLLGLIVNFIKIPRFSYLLGKRLIHSEKNFSFC